jgi:hypothetical protein
MAGAPQRRWVGSGAMPGNLGYVRATAPLIVLEVTGSRITLRWRPKLLAKALEKLSGISALQAAAGDAIAIVPARSWWQNGLEFRVPGSPSYYFWTAHWEEISAILADIGFTVR